MCAAVPVLWSPPGSPGAIVLPHVQHWDSEMSGMRSQIQREHPVRQENEKKGLKQVNGKSCL